jgi:hypothetical protein
VCRKCTYSHFSNRHTHSLHNSLHKEHRKAERERSIKSSQKSDENRLPIPPLINPHLQILLGLHIATDNRPRSARILISEQSGLFLHVIFVFVSEEA